MMKKARSGRLIKHSGRVISLAPGILIVALGCLSAPAHAADECGPDGPGADTLTCAGGTFADGITYTDSDGLTLVLDDPALNVTNGSSDSAISVQSNSTTTQTVSVIVRRLGTITQANDFDAGIAVTNEGFGASTLEFDTGTVLALDPNEGGGGLSNRIRNSGNTNVAATDLRGGLIETTGDIGIGVSTTSGGLGGTRTTMTGGTIRTAGEFAPGVASSTVLQDSKAPLIINMSGGEISTTGTGSRFGGLGPNGLYGLTGTQGDLTILMEGGTISTTGDVAYGIYGEMQFLFDGIISAENTISATMTGGSISTQGTESHGLVARNFASTSGAEARTRMDDGTITVNGVDTVGMLASSWGRGLAEAVMTGGQITNTGTNGTGVRAWIGEWAREKVARVTVTGGTVSTTGDGGYGLHARTGTDADVEIAMSGGSVTTTGDNAHGVFAERAVNFGNQGIGVQITGGTLETTGAGAHGIYALNLSTGDTQILTTTDITASGALADAIRVDAREGTFDIDVVAGTVTGGALASGTLTAATIQTIGAAGGTIDIHADAAVSTPSGSTAIRDGDGDTQMHIAGRVLHGIDAGTGDDSITFAATSVVGRSDTMSQVLLGDGSDTVVIESGADLSALFGLHGGAVGSDPDIYTDRLTLVGDIGLLAPRTLTGWEVVTIDGGQYATAEFTGLSLGTGADQGLFLRNGSTFFIQSGERVFGNVDISADSSVTGVRAGIFGPSPGFHYIDGSVRNAGRIMAQNNIAGDRFFIRDDYAGGGVLAFDADLETGQADTLTISGDVTSPGTQITIVDLSDGRAGGADITLVNVAGTTADGDFVLAQGAVTSGAYSYVLNRTGTSWQLTPGLSAAVGAYQSAGYVLGAFMDNAGTSGGVRSARAGAMPTDQARGAWVEASGSRFDVTSAGAAPTAISGSTRRLRFGYETLADTSGAGQWVFGLTGQIGTLSATSSSAGGTSRIAANGVGLGATAKWFGANGLYVDTGAHLNRLSVDYAANGVPLASDETVMTYAVHMALGQRLALTTAQTIIPEMALSWSHVASHRFSDAQGTLVDVASHDRLTGRFGLAYEYKNQRSNRSSETFFAKGNIVHDFSADSSAVVGGTALDGAFDDTWIEIGLGASHAWNGTTEIYGDVSYKHGLDRSGSALSLNAGYKVAW